MDWSELTIRRLRGLIVFTTIIVVGLWNYEIVLEILQFLWKVLLPFVLGGAITFIINVPMSFIETKLFGEDRDKRGRWKKKLARPVSLILTITLVFGVIVLVMFVVIPQLGSTLVSLGNSIAAFIPKMQTWIREFTNNNPDVMEYVNTLEFQPDKIIQAGMNLVGTGAGSVMDTTLTAARSIASGITTFFIAFSFACYVLIQKERLHVQVRTVFYAFVLKRRADVLMEVCSLTYKTFSSFLAGQCVEALILGSMFVIVMTLFQMPYALLIGTLIAFTALIPIFGAFIGCAVGTLLLFMVEPKVALIFLILFLVLQQIEGNLIYPHVVGNSVGLPSIWVLAAVSIGGNLMGVVGMLIFIPIVSVVYTLFREVVRLKLKQQKIKHVTAKTVVEYTEQEVEEMREAFQKEQEMRNSKNESS